MLETAPAPRKPFIYGPEPSCKLDCALAHSPLGPLTVCEANRSEGSGDARHATVLRADGPVGWTLGLPPSAIIRRLSGGRWWRVSADVAYRAGPVGVHVRDDRHNQRWGLSVDCAREK